MKRFIEDILISIKRRPTYKDLWYRCPNCGGLIKTVYEMDKCPSQCSNCGQLFKWK